MRYSREVNWNKLGDGALAALQFEIIATEQCSNRAEPYWSVLYYMSTFVHSLIHMRLSAENFAVFSGCLTE